MSTVATFTKAGVKAATAAKLNKDIFAVEAKNHELLRQAYETYLANGRTNLAKTKTRGEVRGGGKKPWRQKGTGRARFGSTRNPIWRSGGIAFGPTGQENYHKKLNVGMKRLAIKQALSLAAAEKRLMVIEAFDCKEGRVAPTVKLLNKLGIEGNVLVVVDQKDDLVNQATRNVPNLQVAQANYLNVFDILNADHIVVSQKSIPVIEQWLSDKNPSEAAA